MIVSMLFVKEAVLNGNILYYLYYIISTLEFYYDTPYRFVLMGLTLMVVGYI